MKKFILESSPSSGKRPDLTLANDSYRCNAGFERECLATFELAGMIPCHNQEDR